ncbi:MAG: CDP-glycerol glycerophosphotransferase family protein, partial [Pseudolysinimonas sp.]
RSSSRWIVTNEWLRTRFKKRSFQTVLQTWHGSMYKKIGLDRANMNASHYRLLKQERANWDMFISQNAPGTEIIQHAYDFERKDVIESGYPRNDELQGVTDAQRAEVRKRLGVPDGVRLAMYAPTWRLPAGEGEEGLLDPVRMAADLGPGWTLLLRGHVRTLGNSDAVIERGIIDVGTYPQVSELFMVADVLITDYSSMMFDYSVTGKPMIFFAPDIDQYSDDDVRGAYFDLQKLAPGPVVLTQDEVRDLLLVEGLSWHADFAEKYAAWTAMFNHADDGEASRRATDALFSRSAPARAV